MLPWRGRLFFRVYNATKILKYRILIHNTTGYLRNFEISHAQGQKLLETIKTVVSPYTNLWHRLYMDSYYKYFCNIKFEFVARLKNVGGLPESN